MVSNQRDAPLPIIITNSSAFSSDERLNEDRPIMVTKPDALGFKCLSHMFRTIDGEEFGADIAIKKPWFSCMAKEKSRAMLSVASQS